MPIRQLLKRLPEIGQPHTEPSTSDLQQCLATAQHLIAAEHAVVAMQQALALRWQALNQGIILDLAFNLQAAQEADLFNEVQVVRLALAGRVTEVLDAVTEALRGPFRLRVRYKSADAAERILEPHGVLLGHRTYLVARDPAKGDLIRTFRLDQILSAEVLDVSFVLDPDFSMERFAARSFGVWQDPEQYGEVVWRFSARAAEKAAGFRFHPSQRLEPQPDGSLIVRFAAAGWLEMAWHLYQWGDAVEVLAPDGLRAMVEGHRRADFGSMP